MSKLPRAPLNMQSNLSAGWVNTRPNQVAKSCHACSVIASTQLPVPSNITVVYLGIPGPTLNVSTSLYLICVNPTQPHSCCWCWLPPCSPSCSSRLRRCRHLPHRTSEAAHLLRSICAAFCQKSHWPSTSRLEKRPRSRLAPGACQDYAATCNAAPNSQKNFIGERNMQFDTT